MKLPEAVEENLTFLLAEIDGQLSKLTAFFASPRVELAQQLIQRAGYSSNLARRVHKGCFGPSGKKAHRHAIQLEGVDNIARNLDLISRLGRRTVEHAVQIERVKLLRPNAFASPISDIRDALGKIATALSEQDSKRAVEIGKARETIDIFQDQLFRTYTRDMRASKHTEDLAHALLALNEIGRMGAALSEISEALLSINLGQAVQFERYFTLRNVLAGLQSDDEDVALQPLAETRSGSAISSVQLKGAAKSKISAVFKDGDRRKVKEERVGVKSWNSVYPGLAPEILSYEKRGQSAALLIEHLEGETFEDIVLGASQDRLDVAQKALHKTVRDIWRKTMTDDPAEMGAMAQLTKRMSDVTRLHPDFAQGTQTIQDCETLSFDALLAAAAKREARLPAPFSVYIHGDFNLDNIIYDTSANKIRFIDLHRSRYMDYVQDVSVFMVSNYRLQVLDADIRTRIANVACDMHAVAAKFARANKDTTFEYRLALGLARSFASSTRFIVDRGHAKRMMHRARYILETALSIPEGKEARLKLPMKDLFRD